jgi:hypothetical protein
VNDGLPELGLTTSDDLWPEQRFFFRSDQFHFMRKEIPSLFFFTGVHECYHRPCDTVDFVDHDKAARVARLLAHSVLRSPTATSGPSGIRRGSRKSASSPPVGAEGDRGRRGASGSPSTGRSGPGSSWSAPTGSSAGSSWTAPRGRPWGTRWRPTSPTRGG